MSAQAVSGILAAAILGCSIAALAVPEALSQGTIAGEARVVDGDTIVINATPPYSVGSHRVRLWGIDAPEVSQQCGGEVYCGLAARRALADAIGKDVVRCEVEGHDRYGREVARCGTARVSDLGALMVGTGNAIDYTRYSHGHYRDAEDAAKAERLGIWRLPGFVNPEDWRRGKR
jgi:endonuclease YncB( thermonuclease family)